MGYIGPKPAKDVVFAGLKRLEYRGYDSVGIAVLDKKVVTKKAVGDTSKLNISPLPARAYTAIGHTRWATHGKPSENNAHPHTFGDVTLVHNGIIENYQELRESIDSKKLKSETDSEILAAVIDKFFQEKNDLLSAVQQALAEVKGTFGIVVISPKEPDVLYVARRGSPIVIGVGKDQNIVASDPSVIGEYTDKVIFLEDDQIAKVTPSSVDVYDVKLQAQALDITTLEEGEIQAELGKFGSFLEKEILEQPESLNNVMRGRVSSNGTIKLGGPDLGIKEIESIRQIVIIGCGTSYYAGLYARYKLEEMLGIPVSVEHASEFRYRYGAYDTQHSLAIFMSQSGETADVLASLQEAKRRHFMTMGIVNAVGSSVARGVDYGGVYLHAGQEVSVASTKAYSSMVVALLMFGAQLVYQSGGNSNITKQVAHELLALPGEFEATFTLREQIKKVVPKLLQFKTWFYLGRNDLYPVALEGALKLTEISYIHAQAFPSGEMKHGPISLIDENHLSVLLLPEDSLLYEKGISALEEIKARGGHVLTISTRAKPKGSDFHLQIAHCGDYIDGLVFNVCLQLLALEVAQAKGVDIDKPRNLAKSVTVE